MIISIDTDRDIISLEGGLDIALDVLRIFANPDPNVLYRFEKADGVVICTVMSDDDGTTRN
jgi:hypothetical protein